MGNSIGDGARSRIRFGFVDFRFILEFYNNHVNEDKENSLEANSNLEKMMRRLKDILFEMTKDK